jgi:surfeit locus 1 family protein
MWQLRRGEVKKQQSTAIELADRMDPVLWQGQLSEELWLKRFRFSGRFRADGAVYLDNRIRNGKVGYELLVPLDIQSGKLVVVNLGWVPKSSDIPLKANLPNTEVSFLGRLTPNTQHYLELAPDEGKTVWQNLNWVRYQALVQTPLYPAIAIATENNFGFEGFKPPANDGSTKNFSYAGQWFLFAALAIVLFCRFHLKKTSND